MRQVDGFYPETIGSAGSLTLEPPPARIERVRTSAPTMGLTDAQCRAINVVVALVGLILALPVMLCVALLVKLTSRGPVLYTQPRVGIDRRRRIPRGADGGDRRQSDTGGRIFTIYKFRTMTNAPRASKQVWASADDPRITRVGRVLRKYRLDELPQLVNVLRGEMNVVGPRPEQPALFVELRQQVPDYQHRQQVLPGITGWAQVNHHYDMSVDDVRRKVQLDLEYLSRRSPLEDLRIMARTMPVMVMRKGAQ